MGVVACLACVAPSGAEPALWLQRAAERSVLLPGLRLVEDPATAGGSAAPPPPDAAAGAGSMSQRRRYVVPVLLSALVPGAGEIAAGHPWRGLPFVAADAATWIGYAHYRSEGRDWRRQYEDFANAHWNYDRFDDPNGNGEPDTGEIWGWRQNLERYYGPSQPNPALRWYDPTAPYGCNCPFIPREDDPQHYYENIGKYRYYWMGWDDWEYAGDANAVNSDSRSHRREYGLMRIESNENFDNATRLIVVGMATRLASVVQTVFLVRGNLNAEQQFSVRPAMLPGRAAGIELSLKY